MSVILRFITRNWRLKLASFALAIFLWGVVTVQPRNRQTLTAIPIQVTVRDDGWTLAGPPSPSTVDVRLGGSTRELLQLPRGTDVGVVRVTIDQVTSADTVVRLRNDWVQLDASGLVVENVVPATVRLRFERTEATALPLSVRTRNDFEDGLALAQPLGLTPPVVRVSGAARVVQDLDSIPLEPLDLAAVTESGIYRVRVDTTGLEGLTVSPEIASLAVRLERAVERVVGGVPVLAEAPRGVEGPVVVVPGTIQVTLRGALTPVNQANVDSLVAVVAPGDLAGLAPGEERTVQIRLRGVPLLVRAFSAVDSVRVLLMEPAAVPRDTVRRDTIDARPEGGGVPLARRDRAAGLRDGLARRKP